MENENRTGQNPDTPEEEKRHLTSAERQQIYAERASVRRREEYQRRKKERKKRIVVISAAALLFAVAVVVMSLLTVNVFIPASKISNAEKLFADGRYLEAYDIYLELGDYQNAPARAEECIIKNAQSLAGREEVIIGTSASMPWFSITEDGTISFDEDIYRGDKKIVIPDVFNDTLVRSIADKAFAWADYPEEIVLPPSVEYIGEQAFFSCQSLVSLTLPDSVKRIGEKAFSECIALKSVSFGSGLTEIGARAFSRCIALTSLTIPEGVQVIGYRAFNTCNALTNLSLPSTVTEIGGHAFTTDEKKLTNVTYNGTLAELSALCTADGNNIILEAKGLICMGDGQ